VLPPCLPPLDGGGRQHEGQLLDQAQLRERALVVTGASTAVGSAERKVELALLSVIADRELEGGRGLDVGDRVGGSSPSSGIGRSSGRLA
jgi:hypothetical protein